MYTSGRRTIASCQILPAITVCGAGLLELFCKYVSRYYEMSRDDDCFANSKPPGLTIHQMCEFELNRRKQREIMVAQVRVSLLNIQIRNICINTGLTG